MTTRWRRGPRILAVFICESEPFHLASGQWFIPVWNSDSFLNWIVSNWVSVPFAGTCQWVSLTGTTRPTYILSQWFIQSQDWVKFAPIFSGDANCTTLMSAITPIARMLLSMMQIQFIFLNTTDLDMGRHKVISRFGLMHMVATNLCEWLYVLVEETKHEIHHFQHLMETSSKQLQSALLSTVRQH